MVETVAMTLSCARSVDLVASAQTVEAAFPASTGQHRYRHGWLRDGSWCAYALQRAGRRQAAAAWHHWVARALLAHEHRFDQALRAVRTNAVTGQVMMPARFTLDRREETSGADGKLWPNVQTDCYGLWLWALADHLARGGHLDDTLTGAARLVIAYLRDAGELPCYDCWEEHPGHVHTSSLAAVAAGLPDAGSALGDPAAQDLAARLTTRLTGPEHTLAGALIRFPRDTRVDGSLLWIAVPFNLLDIDSALFGTTLTRIRDELADPGGGVRRYLGDTF